MNNPSERPYPPAVVMIGIGLLAIFAASGAHSLALIASLGVPGSALLAAGCILSREDDE